MSNADGNVWGIEAWANYVLMNRWQMSNKSTWIDPVHLPAVVVYPPAYPIPDGHGELDLVQYSLIERVEYLAVWQITNIALQTIQPAIYNFPLPGGLLGAGYFDDGNQIAWRLDEFIGDAWSCDPLVLLHPVLDAAPAIVFLTISPPPLAKWSSAPRYDYVVAIKILDTSDWTSDQVWKELLDLHMPEYQAFLTNKIADTGIDLDPVREEWAI